jgi:hypothetical protein
VALNLDDLPISRKQALSIAGALPTPQLAVWTGAVASGKTIASLIAFLIMVTRAPESGLIDSVMKAFRRWTPVMMAFIRSSSP